MLDQVVRTGHFLGFWNLKESMALLTFDSPVGSIGVKQAAVLAARTFCDNLHRLAFKYFVLKIK